MNEHVKTIEKALKNILPWVEFNENEISTYTEKNPDNYLKRFYLFSTSELNICNDIKDINKFINECYLNVLASAHKANLTLLTVIIGNNGKVNVYLGFLTDDREKTPYIYQKILEGVFPGIKINHEFLLSLDKLMSGKQDGGIISGIPTLKIDEEKLKFNISSVVRSMYGENYTLLIISKPVEKPELAIQFNKLIKIRDDCHEIANKTITTERGGEKSKQKQDLKNESVPLIKDIAFKTAGGIAGALIGSVVPVVGTSSGALLGAYLASSFSKSISTSKGDSTGTGKHWSESLSREQQNGLALELEKIADSFINRIKKGLNVGYWETTITFACETKAGAEILGGSFLGELSKPSSENFPANINFSKIDKERLALIPKINSTSDLFPKSLCSYITSEELSLIASPPTESLPGYEIKKMPPLSLTDLTSYGKKNSFKIGHISDYGKPLENSTFSVADDDLLKHTFVCGITGSGKTTTVKSILKNASIPFLVLESAKRDYRQLLGDDAFKDKLNIYTIGDTTISPIRLNPFYILPGILPLSHIDFLKAIFNASFSLYGPMPYILEKCLYNIYVKRGWNLTKGTHPFFLTEAGEFDEKAYEKPEHYYCFPTLDDLKDEVESYVKTKLDYRGELSDNIRTAIVTRIGSLSVGAKGLMFNTYEIHDFKELLNNPTIFEMEALSDDDDKAFFVGLILTFISEFRQLNNPAIDPWKRSDRYLQHLLVIEEAHRLLKNVTTERTTEMMGNPKGKAVEFFCNIISEMRALGQGVIVIEQIPTKIALDVIKNTNTKIVHRLVSKDDQSLLAGSLSISDDDALYLSRLKTGFALCHKEGMERPVEAKMASDVKDIKISHEKVMKVMSCRSRKIEQRDLELNEFKQITGKKGDVLVLQFLNSLLTIESGKTKELMDRTKKELNRICINENYIDYFKDDTINLYIIYKLMQTFSRGVYCKGWKSPSGLLRFLEAIINGTDENRTKELEKLKSLLASYWKKKDTGEFVKELVSELIINYHQEKKDGKLDDIKLDKMVRDYFFAPEESIIHDILERFEDEGVYGKP